MTVEPRLNMLRKFGFQTDAADNGRQDSHALNQRDYDLVPMDEQMPEMDGLTATALIRDIEKNSGKRLPIVAMTASAMKGDREKCLKAGMDDYISKPIDPEEMFKKVKQ
jgi:two-component system sensor histidine kinase/response regulator